MNHTTNPQAARAELSAKLWQIAEHHIVAEWICCEPVDPKHELCAKGHAALGMVRTLLVDSPEAWNPAAPLLDAVLGMLPAASPSVVVSADRATLLREAADHLDALPLSGVEGGIRSALTDELRRVAAEEQPAETQAAVSCAYRVAEISEGKTRRIHGYYDSLEGAFAYCETEERQKPLLDSVRFELFAAPGDTQWLIHMYYGLGDKCPEVSDFVIRRVEVIADQPTERPAVGEQPDTQTREA